jgi:hypothetical protein
MTDNPSSMTTFSTICDCGHKNFFDCVNEPGVIVVIHCERCDKELRARLPEEHKYRSRGKTERVERTILDIFDEMQPRLTVRQIYYSLTVRNVVPKTEAGYRQTCYHLAIMRKNGSLPYGWIADNTRWFIRDTTYTGLDAALDRWQQAYRRDLWADQRDYVEIWVEKDALAGVISPITREYDVPLYVARGYGSMTFVYEAAEELKRINKPTFIYHFGDFDPSGVDAAYKIRDGLTGHGANINFQRVAVDEWQITNWKLPTRETKKKDPRAKAWGDKPSAELDAIPAPKLRELVRGCIEGHIDRDLLRTAKEVERLERETLASVRNNLVQVPNCMGVLNG